MDFDWNQSTPAAAVGAVAIGGILTYLNSAAVSVMIKNNGCAPITPVVNAPAFAKASAGKEETAGWGEIDGGVTAGLSIPENYTLS